MCTAGIQHLNYVRYGAALLGSGVFCYCLLGTTLLSSAGYMLGVAMPF